MIEESSGFLYDIKHPHNVLPRFSIQFGGEEHSSLIYEKLLPQYCASRPHLKMLDTKAEGE